MDKLQILEAQIPQVIRFKGAIDEFWSDLANPSACFVTGRAPARSGWTWAKVKESDVVSSYTYVLPP